MAGVRVLWGGVEVYLCARLCVEYLLLGCVWGGGWRCICVHGVLTAGVRVLSAAMAAFRIGMATARSASHSSLIALAAIACSFATASSAFTTCTTHGHVAENPAFLTQ